MTRPWLLGLAIVAGLAVGVTTTIVVPRHEPPSPSAPRVALATPELPRAGLPDCPVVAIDDLLSLDALECWFHDEDLGTWHVTSAVDVQGVIVVHLVAADLRVADVVVRRLVGQADPMTLEILLYAHDASDTRVRRARWTPKGGFDLSEFGGR